MDSGEYYVNCSKLRYWINSTTIIIGAGEAETLNSILWLKGDLNDNGIAADAVDLGLMKDASVGTITADWRYDFNMNGIFADAGDQGMLKDASVGTIELV